MSLPYTLKSTSCKIILMLSVITSLTLGTHLICFAADYKVSSPEEISAAMENAKPGDTLIMKNGIWENVKILFQGKGTEDKPVTLRAETPGQVIIKGESQLKIAGSYLVADGLVFREVTAKSKIGLVDFSNRPQIYSDHCRLTNTVIEDCNPPEEMTDYKWVSLYGQYNRVDHCYFRNKTNIGTLLVVWRDDDSPNYHLIDHNYFGYTARHAVNGGEAIRVGDSNQSLSDSYTTVEYNYFEHCNGDMEVISNKSGQNTYRFNTFFENEGSLCLRHGNDCTIEGNFFIQNHLPNSVGIRVLGENHKILNNYFYGIGASGGTMRAALNLINGVPDSPLNRYFQVKNLLVANNTFVDNEKNIMIGGGKSKELSLPPIDCRFSNNIVLSGYGPLVNLVDEPINITYENNIMYGSDTGAAAQEGIIITDPELLMSADGLYRLQKDSKAVDAGSGEYVKTDMDGQPRSGKPDTGADEMSQEKINITPMNPGSVGPQSFKPGKGKEDLNVRFDGKDLRFGQPAVKKDGTVMIPLRSIAAVLGAKTDWDNETRSITLTGTDLKVVLKLGANALKLNDKELKLDMPAVLVNERTLVSIKFITDVFSKKASWDETSQVLTITSIEKK